MEICPHGAQGAPVLNAARAEASRRNGAKSRGPKSAEGKARSSQNAMKHGLRARRWVLLGGESETEFKRLEAALIEEWAPEGVTQSLLVQQIAAAAWRLGRAEQIETQIITNNTLGSGSRSLGLAVIRDRNNPGALDTLIRYRGSTQTEFFRALRTLKALRAEAAQAAAGRARRAQPNEPETRIDAGGSQGEARSPDRLPSAGAPAGDITCPTPFQAPTVPVPARPDEPERPENPGESGRTSHLAAQSAEPGPASRRLRPPAPAKPAPFATPIEPECPKNPDESALQPAGTSARNGNMSLLAGTALVPPGVGAWCSDAAG